MKTYKLFFMMIFFLSALAVSTTAASINNGSPEGEQYLAFAEKMPAPVGGLPAIYKKIKYPVVAKKAGLEGKVYLIAFVDENGKVEDVKILKGIGGGCDEAAADAIKETSFTPGENKGKPVRVKLSLAIQFKLN
ncbi:MAG: energy transducer TonB [Chlorobi bacterium]|nr:energy transducer TonB [Chlorobiota bacterium]